MLSSVLLDDYLDDLRAAYQAYVVDKGREGRFLGTASYCIGSGIRILTFASLVRRDKTHIEFGGVHIHHMVPGMLAVLGAGLWSLDRRVGAGTAIAFGAGSAFLLDEFSLILFVKDVYWEKHGVLASSLAVGTFGVALSANLLLGWRAYQVSATKTGQLAVTLGASALRKLQGVV